MPALKTPSPMSCRTAYKFAYKPAHGMAKVNPVFSAMPRTKFYRLEARIPQPLARLACEDEQTLTFEPSKI